MHVGKGLFAHPLREAHRASYLPKLLPDAGISAASLRAVEPSLSWRGGRRSAPNTFQMRGTHRLPATPESRWSDSSFRVFRIIRLHDTEIPHLQQSDGVQCHGGTLRRILKDDCKVAVSDEVVSTATEVACGVLVPCIAHWAFQELRHCLAKISKSDGWQSQQVSEILARQAPAGVGVRQRSVCYVPRRAAAAALQGNVSHRFLGLRAWVYVPVQHAERQV